MKVRSPSVAAVVVLCSLGATCTAQGVTTVAYPGGPSAATSPSLNGIPFSTSFGTDITYQLHIPAATLPARPAMLTDVAFAPSATGAFVMNNLVLSIGHGTIGAPTCNLAGNSNDLTVQFSGAWTYSFVANTWSSLGLPILFPYNGNTDLIIEIRNFGATGTGGSFRDRDAGTNVQRVYNRLAGGFTATTCSHAVSLGIKVALTFVQADVVAGPATPGATCQLTFDSPTDPFLPYLGALSFGTGPLVFNPADPRTIDLAADDLFLFTFTYPFLFPGLNGVLDGSGLATALVPIPLGVPTGTTFHASFVTLDAGFPSSARQIALTGTITVL
jgi:hypothetical protein